MTTRRVCLFYSISRNSGIRIQGMFFGRWWCVYLLPNLESQTNRQANEGDKARMGGDMYTRNHGSTKKIEKNDSRVLHVPRGRKFFCKACTVKKKFFGKLRVLCNYFGETRVPIAKIQFVQGFYTHLHDSKRLLMKIRIALKNRAHFAKFCRL